MKKVLTIIVLAVMVLALSNVLAFAATTQTTEKAELLKQMGLFKGTDVGFELDRKPTRIEALVMLVRLLGKEDDALSTTSTHPFKDVATWADKYVAYAYTQGLTNGISKTEFGSNNVANSNMYLTFVLRALGYSDANNADFSWDNPNTLATSVGILNTSINLTNFNRGDVVLVSYNSLTSKIKLTTKTLYEKLEEESGIITGFMNVSLTSGTTTLSTVKTNEYKTETSLTIKATPSEFVDQIEYYWDEDGISKRTVLSLNTKTITIPNDFDDGEEYILYIRAKDLSDNYTSWKKYVFEISKEEEKDDSGITMAVKVGTTTLSTTKTYTYPVDTSIKITATPSADVESIQYYWDEDGISSKKTVSSNTKTITIPDDFDEDEEYVLYVRALNDDGDYSDWKKYTFKIGEADDSGITMAVKVGTTTLSTTKTYTYPVDTSVKIIATPSSDVEDIQYYWDEDGISNKKTVSSYTKTITIPDDFDDGEEYILYVRALNDDGDYSDWYKYKFKIGKADDSGVTITTKVGTTTLSTTKTYIYPVETSIKMTATPSSDVESIQYYWNTNGLSSKKTISSYTKTIEIPDDFEGGKEYILYVRAINDDGDYSDWSKYTFKIDETDNTGITITVKQATTTLLTTKTYDKYAMGTELNIVASSSTKTSSLEYYWSDEGSNNKVAVDSYKADITIPTRFTKGEEYILFIRAKDTSGEYTDYYQYKFEIPEDLNVVVKQGTTELSTARVNEFEVGTSLTIKATPTDNISAVYYKWGDELEKSSSTKTITIPTTYTVGNTYTLKVRAKDTSGKYTDYATYSIKIVVEVDSISLNKEALTLEEEDDETLTVTFNPTNATNQNIAWSSSEQNVATVNQSGKVTAVSTGTAIIHVITDNGERASCTVTVTPKVAEPTV